MRIKVFLYHVVLDLRLICSFTVPDDNNHIIILILMSKFLDKASYNLNDTVTCLDMSRGGSYFAAGLLDETVVLWKGEINKDN